MLFTIFIHQNKDPGWRTEFSERQTQYKPNINHSLSFSLSLSFSYFAEKSPSEGGTSNYFNLQVDSEEYKNAFLRVSFKFSEFV